jgi:putative DNA primase/helicase
MLHKGTEAVRERIEQAVELCPPQYVSFGCYQMDGDGLALLVTKGKGDEQTSEKIAISGQGWARLLRWSDDDKRVHRHAVSDADLHGDISALCANLANRGLRIATDSKRRTHLVHYLNEAGRTV